MFSFIIFRVVEPLLTFVGFCTVMLSAVQDILRQLHLREGGPL